MFIALTCPGIYLEYKRYLSYSEKAIFINLSRRSILSLYGKSPFGTKDIGDGEPTRSLAHGVIPTVDIQIAGQL